MPTENDFNIDDPAYWDALSRLAKVLATYSAQFVHKMIEEDRGDQLLSDLLTTFKEEHPEFHDGLEKLAQSCMSALQEIKAEIFFGNEEQTAAGRRALEAVGFDIEPRPGKHQTVWLTAYGYCPADAGTPEMIQNLEALIKPQAA